MLQFEVETKQSNAQRFFRRFVSKAINIRNQQKHKEHMMKSMIGGFSEPHWAIGDVDNILKGNLPTPVHLDTDKVSPKKNSKWYCLPVDTSKLRVDRIVFDYSSCLEWTYSYLN